MEGSGSERFAGIVDRIERAAGHRFRDEGVARLAMTHSSAKEEGFECNERLEFLGDAVLGHVVCEHLYRAFPDRSEGDLSVIKSVLVSARYLAKAAREIGLGDLVVVGKGIAERRLPSSVLANAFEALTAAIYLDSDLATVREFLERALIFPNLLEVADRPQEKNYKSMLQDHVQKAGLPLPGYRVARAVGPDHRKRFQVVVEVNGQQYGPTWGYNKKEAEQRAARQALLALGLLRKGEDGTPSQEAPGEGPAREGEILGGTEDE